MPLDFPTSPSVGTRVTIDVKTWEYNGKGWKLIPNPTQGLQGSQGTALQGVQGSLSNFQGTQGVQGRQGTQGSTVQGVQGTQGLQGAQGTFGPATIPESTDTFGSGDTIVAADNGKVVKINGGLTIANVFTIVGQNVVVYNDSASQQTLTVGAGITLRLAGTAQTGTRYLQSRGLATILCITASASGTPPAEYVISGAGVT